MEPISEMLVYKLFHRNFRRTNMEKRWWHKSCAYQIYPKSFCDSNGDGIGDIKGITGKLDYLKELGVDIIWLSPVYCSPFADQGYDISNYYDIDPKFGTMEDFDILLQEAKKRDQHIIMDLVVNHCSDEHEWFKKACEDPDGKYGKYFYIMDHKKGESFPCNWRSYFGGPCWDLLPGHEDKIYLHVFHKKQPDLNWENKEVREEIYKMVNWWLDKGISGFRIDAIINIKKKLPFKDYPVDRPDGLSSIDHMLEEAKGVEIYLNELADRTFKPHDAFSVGEVFNEKADALPGIIGDNGFFSSMFDFSSTLINRTPGGWYDWKSVKPDQYKAAVFGAQKKSNGVGFLSNIIENHDEPRGVSRYLPDGERSDAAKKMLGGVNFMLCGLPFIYQGQEIGMENCVFSDISMIDDCNTAGEYKTALDAGLSKEEALKAVSQYCRDNARTPFHWSSEKNAGFTTGTPWINVNPNYEEINLASQRGREDSVFEWYKKLISTRKDPEYSETIVYGETVPYLEKEENLMAYLRKGDKTLFVAGLFQKEEKRIKLPGKIKKVLLNNMDKVDEKDGSLLLKGWQFIMAEID